MYSKVISRDSIRNYKKILSEVVYRIYIINTFNYYVNHTKKYYNYINELIKKVINNAQNKKIHLLNHMN